ncbi:MAG: conjugal transfer protein TraG N-terminal domain-containing protein [Candidatus Omnitrophica bacterium]|nr:conjugal transfer protein TraG N-terminal domain-containing protein [Candidatus Omnitrophota bacterium]
MITGITPLDSAYSYGGYIVAGQLMRKLIPVYAGVVASASIWIIYKGLLEHTLKPVIIYLITVGLISAFFIPTRIISSSSAAGQAGAPLLANSQALTNSLGYVEGRPASAGLGLIGEMIDGITTWTIKGIENAGNLTQSDKYIGGSPFSAIYTDNMILTAHISNIKTRDEFIDFLKGPFSRAFTQWKNSGNPQPIHSQNKWYPGTWDAYYTPKELQQWETIKKGIITDAQKKYGKFNWWGKLRLEWENMYNNSKNFDNVYIKWVINNEIQDDTQGITGQLTKGLGRGELSTGITNPLGRIIQFISKLILQVLAGTIVPALPAFQGAVCFIVIAFFPIIFLISLFPSSFNWLSWYFLTLFWVKSWSIGWAILNVFQNIQWSFFRHLSPVYTPGFSGMPFINNMSFVTLPLITLVLIFVMPVIEWELLSKGRGTVVAAFNNMSIGGRMVHPAIRV